MEWVNRPTKIICYTFGAPRLGNYAFAETYNRLVPETWNVVNDQVQVNLSPTTSYQPHPVLTTPTIIDSAKWMPSYMSGN